MKTNGQAKRILDHCEIALEATDIPRAQAIRSYLEKNQAAAVKKRESLCSNIRQASADQRSTADPDDSSRLGTQLCELRGQLTALDTAIATVRNTFDLLDKMTVIRGVATGVKNQILAVTNPPKKQSARYKTVEIAPRVQTIRVG